MQSLSAFFSSLAFQCWGGNPNLSEIPKQNTFPGLPAELLLSIADFLTRDDVICTLLCDRRLFAIFRLRYHPVLRTGRDKLPLLTRLGRDLPNYFICYKCNSLHKYYALKICLPGPQFGGCFGCLQRPAVEFHLPFDQIWARDWVNYHFNLIHLQLAMKRFHYGIEYGISTGDFSYTQVRIRTLQSGTEIPLLSSVDALDGIVGAHHTGEEASVSVTCEYCNTEALVEILECENKMALVITKWMSLGADLTPDDPDWQKYLNLAPAGLRVIKIHRLPDERGRGKTSAVEASVRARFENASVDSLRFRNIAFLKNQRYKKSMTYRPDTVYGPTWLLHSTHG